jgi:ribosomal-protein-alanine N-acetyltransferase
MRRLIAEHMVQSKRISPHVTTVFDCDLTAVVEIEKAAKAHPWPEDALRREFELLRAMPPFVAEAEGQVVGFAMARYLAGEVEITNIVVHPRFQRRSIGARLLQHVFTRGKTKGCIEVFLEVRRSNLPAIRLYEKWGFVQIGVRPGYYIDTKEDAFLMRKSLL